MFRVADDPMRRRAAVGYAEFGGRSARPTLPFRGLHSSMPERREAALRQVQPFLDAASLAALRRELGEHVAALEALGYSAGVVVFESFRYLCRKDGDMAGVRVTVGAGAVPGR